MLKKTKKILNKQIKTNSTESSGYYIAPPVIGMLNKGKEAVLHKDWDRVYIIDGTEGSGKSLLGLQLGFYLDPTLNLNRITFSGEKFAKAVENAKKGQCIIFDEAFNGLSSSGATSKLNRLITRKLQECRQRNLFLIIILPTFFMLQKYAAIFRSKALFHVYSTKKGVRGYYKVYNPKNKKRLYLSGAKLYSYKYPYVKHSYRFYGKYPLDESEYRTKKLEALKFNEDETATPGYQWKVQRDIMIIYLHYELKLTYESIELVYKDCEYPLSSRQIGEICRKFNKST